MNPAIFLKSDRRHQQLVRGILAIGLLSGIGGSFSPTPPAYAAVPAAQRPAPDLTAGKEAFDANCARCHGPTGAGDGPDAKRMFPKPRKLSEGIFKFRTTASGTLPTDEDLFATISTGLPGSRMPEFTRLPEETRWQLVNYIKTLSPTFQEKNSKPEPVEMGVDPGPAKANLAKGKEIYASLKCAACHGEQGRGNGASAPTLVDNWGSPIRPADLTQGWNYRGGAAPKMILARMMTGIDGTPMPSYADAIPSKEDAWALAYYVASLQEPPHWNRTVEARKISQALPSSPDDPAWQGAVKTDLQLSNQLYQNGQYQPTRVNAISIQAVYNEEAVVFRLRWNDPDESRGNPSDAVGVALVSERPLKWEIGSLRSWPAVEDAPALDLSYWSAERNAAEEVVVRSTAELETGKTAGEPLESRAAYADGTWTLILKRPFQSPLANRAALDSKNPILIGLAVWDGGNNEQGRRRANSNWINLALK